MNLVWKLLRQHVSVPQFVYYVYAYGKLLQNGEIEEGEEIIKPKKEYQAPSQTPKEKVDYEKKYKSAKKKAE